MLDRVGEPRDAGELSERDVDADANGARAKRSHLAARFEAEQIAEGEAVAADVEEIIDVHGQAHPSETQPGADPTSSW